MAIRGWELGIYMVAVSILVSSFVAAVNEKVIIDIPGSFVLNGKNISVLGMGQDMISVDIDGVVENVEQDKINNKSTFVNGVYIQIIALSKTPTRAVLNITVEISCGDDRCSSGEDYTICCADCGCSSSSLVCSNNRCVENITSVGAKHQCYQDADCNDQNSCTTERCDTSEFPNKCVRADVTACIAGDSCCPKLCDTDQDADCTMVDKCDTEADCIDNEACTQETCAGTPKRCQVSHQEGCTYENACVIKGTVREGRYCEAKSHEWLLQKVDSQSCTENFECITGICDGSQCGKDQSKMLTYAFFPNGLLSVVIVDGYISL